MDTHVREQTSHVRSEVQEGVLFLAELLEQARLLSADVVNSPLHFLNLLLVGQLVVVDRLVMSESVPRRVDDLLHLALVVDLLVIVADEALELASIEGRRTVVVEKLVAGLVLGNEFSLAGPVNIDFILPLTHIIFK